MGGQNSGLQVGRGRSSGPPPGAVCEIVDIAWGTLVELLTLGEATACHYRIVNFHTTHIILGTPSASGAVPDVHIGTIEPLIVTPSGPSTLELIAWSELYPDDTIEYKIIDTTSANPLDGSSRGIITQRSNTVQKINTPYDFRNVVFYRPVSTYDLSAITYPVNFDSIIIDGVSTPLGFGGIFLLRSLTNSLQSLLGSTAVVVIQSPTSFVIWSTNGSEYGDLSYSYSGTESVGTGDNLTITFPFILSNTPITPGSVGITDGVESFTDDGAGNLTGDMGGTGTINYATGVGSVTFNAAPLTGVDIAANYNYGAASITPTFDPSLFYTFGNNIDFSSATFTPAIDGNQIADSWDIHLETITDHFWGQVQNNIVFGTNVTTLYAKEECANSIVANNCAFNYFDRICAAITFRNDVAFIYLNQDCQSFDLGIECAKMYFGQRCGSIFVADGTNSWDIGEACSEITVQGLNNSHWTMKDGCTRISVDGNSNFSWDFGLLCADIIAVGGSNSNWTFGSQSNSILAIGSFNHTWTFGSGTVNVFAVNDTNAVLRMNDNCRNITFINSAVLFKQVGNGDGIKQTFTVNLNYVVPVIGGTITITDGVETFTDNGDGTLTGDMGGAGTINYVTGLGSVTFNSAPANLASVTANFNFSVAGTGTSITNETIATGDTITVTFPFTIANFPIVPGLLTITDLVETFSDNGDGTLTGDMGGAGTINYATGIGSVTFNAPPSINPIFANYDIAIISNDSCHNIEIFTSCDTLQFTSNSDVSIQLQLSTVTFPAAQSHRRCSVGYSNWEAWIDVTDSDTVDLTNYPVERYLHLQSRNSSENIDVIIDGNNLFKINFDLGLLAGFAVSDINIRHVAVSTTGNILVDFKDQTMVAISSVVNVVSPGIFTLQGATSITEFGFFDACTFEPQTVVFPGFPPITFYRMIYSENYGYVAGGGG